MLLCCGTSTLTLQVVLKYQNWQKWQQRSYGHLIENEY